MARDETAEALGLDTGTPDDLSVGEARAVEDHAHLRPLAVHEVIRREGLDELARPMRSLWWSGLTAGLSIGFSIVAQGTLHAMLPDAPWRDLVASFGYAVGFLIVILGRYQLFTEITLTAVLPVLAEPSREAVGALGRLWGTVLVANLVGTFLFAAALSTHAIFPPAQTQGIAEVSRHLADFSASDAFLRGIVAGWLVATVVWLLPTAESARVWVIALLTSMIAILDLSHVVSGSVEIFYLLLRGELGLAKGLFGLLLPLLVGNVIGGAALFALLAHGQVHDELSSQPGKRQARADTAGGVAEAEHDGKTRDPRGAKAHDPAEGATPDGAGPSRPAPSRASRRSTPARAKGKPAP